MARFEVPPPTKEVWMDVGGGADLTGYGRHHAAIIDASGEWADFELRAPHDFRKVIAIEIIIAPRTTVSNMRVGIATHYGAVGEPFNQHAESSPNRSIGVTVNQQIRVIDISDLVDAGPLNAGDLLGVYMEYSSAENVTNMAVLGLRLRYA